MEYFLNVNVKDMLRSRNEFDEHSWLIHLLFDVENINIIK